MIAHTEPDRLLNTDETAALLGISPQTLTDKRWRGGGPPYVKLSRNCVRYFRSAVLEWAAARVVRSTVEANLRGNPKERAP